MIPSRTANSVHVMKMCAAFARAGHDVVLFARRGTGEGGADSSLYAQYGVPRSFRLCLIAARGGAAVASLVYLLKVAAKIFAVDRGTLFYGRHLYSLCIAAALGRPVVYEVHNFRSRGALARLEQWLLSRRSLKRVNAISQALADDYRARYPASSHLIHVLHDGADDPRESELAPVALPADGRFTVGYTGQLYSGKGMEVISQLSYRLPDVHFVVVGGEHKDIADWKMRCRAGNVTFVGYVEAGRISSYLNAFDAVVAPYQRTVRVAGGRGDVAKYMSPLKIFEYMAAGKAIVCSRLPVLEEVLQHEQNALLCEPDDLEDWELALRRLMESETLRRCLAESARRTYETGFSWYARAQVAIG